ncbi:MAG: hypothetical protein V1678_01095 [Candidatus Aenigmatarchaeota archaeon]
MLNKEQYEKEARFSELLIAIAGLFLVISTIIFSTIGNIQNATATLTAISNSTTIKDPVRYNETLRNLDMQRELLNPLSIFFFVFGFCILLLGLSFGYSGYKKYNP